MADSVTKFRVLFTQFREETLAVCRLENQLKSVHTRLLNEKTLQKTHKFVENIRRFKNMENTNVNAQNTEKKNL